MKSSHLLFCGLLLVVGVGLSAGGLSALAFLPLVACMLMMAVMVWTMWGRAEDGD